MLHVPLTYKAEQTITTFVFMANVVVNDGICIYSHAMDDYKGTNVDLMTQLALL